MSVVLRSVFTPRDGSAGPRLAFLAGKTFVFRGRHPEHRHMYAVDVWTGGEFINNVGAHPDEIFLPSERAPEGVAA